MTVMELLQKAKARMGVGFCDVLGLEVLLAHVLGIGKEKLIIDSGMVVSEDKIGEYVDIVERFADGEPVAYLIGKKEFYGLEFVVNKDVLIPRPETELLVDKVLEFCGTSDGTCKILDIGTGCGCIAVSLAVNLKSSVITASDLSVKALDIARENARINGVEEKIEFVVSDLLDDLPGKFDIIAANLPYIGKKKNRFISAEAEKYEPHAALFGGNDGLDLYRKFFGQLLEKNWRPSVLIGEFGFAQFEDMSEALNESFKGYRWEIIKDYANIERVFVVKFK